MDPTFTIALNASSNLAWSRPVERIHLTSLPACLPPQLQPPPPLPSSNMDLDGSRAGEPVFDVGQVQDAVAVVVREAPDAVILEVEGAAAAEDAVLVPGGGGGDVDLDAPGAGARVLDVDEVRGAVRCVRRQVPGAVVLGGEGGAGLQEQLGVPGPAGRDVDLDGARARVVRLDVHEVGHAVAVVVVQAPGPLLLAAERRGRLQRPRLIPRGARRDVHLHEPRGRVAGLDEGEVGQRRRRRGRRQLPRPVVLGQERGPGFEDAGPEPRRRRRDVHLDAARSRAAGLDVREVGDAVAGRAARLAREGEAG